MTKAERYFLWNVGNSAKTDRPLILFKNWLWRYVTQKPFLAIWRFIIYFYCNYLVLLQREKDEFPGKINKLNISLPEQFSKMGQFASYHFYSSVFEEDNCKLARRRRKKPLKWRLAVCFWFLTGEFTYEYSSRQYFYSPFSFHSDTTCIPVFQAWLFNQRNLNASYFFAN